MLSGATPVDEMLEATEPGWPRPFCDLTWHEAPLPLPWINGHAPMIHKRGFLELNGARREQARAEGLCFCCGEPLGRLKVMGRHRASYNLEDRQVWLTDGPPGHPRCVALAAQHCPHLRRQHRGELGFTIAFVYAGGLNATIDIPEDITTAGTPSLLVNPDAETLSLLELRKLAGANPLGL